jgi:hypothetical protein
MSQNSLRETPVSRGLIVLCMVILAQNFLPPDLCLPFIILLGLLISLMCAGGIKLNYLKLVWPLSGVFFFGIMGAFDHASRDILRDVAYALTPLSLIFIGYWMADNGEKWQLILKVMVFWGIVLAGIHLFTFVQDPDLLTAKANEVRSEAGSIGDLTALALVLCFFQKRLGINNLLPRLFPRFIALPVLLASFVLSYSRTEFAVVLVLSLALWGVLSKVNSRFVVSGVVLVVAFYALLLTTPKYESGTFRSKLARTFTEVNAYNYKDLQDINDNWRGYEAHKAFKTYSSGNAVQLMIGQGFGALVDLDLVIALGKTDYRYIPILHNGYAYILVKTGLFGLACYLFFYFSVIKTAVLHANSPISEPRFLARLLLGCVLSLAVTMFVVGGMAERHSSEFVLLLGYLVRRLWLFQAENSSLEPETNSL